MSDGLNLASIKMQEIIDTLQAKLKTLNSVTFQAMNPDTQIKLYAGEVVAINGTDNIHRPLRSWVDLAGLLMCRMSIPRIIENNMIEIKFTKLMPDKSFHNNNTPNMNEKYGTNSDFAKVHKSEEPTFIWAYTKALRAVKIETRNLILDLGVNDADEILNIKNILNHKQFSAKTFTGIDHCSSAINEAKAKLPLCNVNLICHDINNLDTLSLSKYDLIISIGTLQSTTVDMKPIIMSLVQNYLSNNAAMILGFPSSRWIDGELVYGAKAPNYNYPELSLVIKDIYWIKKYLQQHKFRVTITGREYLFLTATKIGKNTSTHTA